jgi:hypothetical protein
VSRTVSRGRATGQQAEAPAVAGTAEPRRRRRTGGWLTAGLVALAAAGLLSAWLAGAFSPARGSAAGETGAAAPATQAVMREDIASTTPVNATLGYAGSYAVTGQGGGKLTSLPAAGQVIRQGQALYKTGNGSRCCCCTAACRTGGPWMRACGAAT